MMMDSHKGRDDGQDDGVLPDSDDVETKAAPSPDAASGGGDTRRVGGDGGGDTR